MKRPAPTESLAQVFGAMRNDYAATKASRFIRKRTGYVGTGSGADYHYANESDYLKLIEVARDFDRNDTIVGMMVDRASDNVVQGGLTLDPQVEDRGLERELRTRFAEWAGDPLQCDAGGRFTFAEFQRQAIRAIKVDGDIFFLPRENGTLECVEGHRCRTPSNTRKNVVHGVLLDPQTRRPLQYWFTKEDVDPRASLRSVSDVVQYPAFGPDGAKLVYHLYSPKRVSQTRGVTAFAPVFFKLGMAEDIDFAKLVQQQIVSCFALLRTIPNAQQFRPGPIGQTGARTTETMTDGTSRLLEGVAPGIEIFGRPGETIAGFSPDVPNPAYFEQMTLLLRLVAASLNLPLVALLLDGSETNFTGWRGAINQAQIGWRREQYGLRDQLVLSVWHWKLAEWAWGDRALARQVNAGKVGVRANLPQWPYVQPEIDAAADEKRRLAMLSSPRRIAMDRGVDYEELADEIVADNAYLVRRAIATAREIAAADGVEIDPRQLIVCDPARPLVLSAEQPAADDMDVVARLRERRLSSGNGDPKPNTDGL